MSLQARQMYVYICHSMACSANVNHERPLFIQVRMLHSSSTGLFGLLINVINVKAALSRQETRRD